MSPMAKVSFIFAVGTSWLDSLVTMVTKSPWSHVALRFDSEDLLVEALVGQGTILQPGSKYDTWPGTFVITRDVKQDEAIQMLLFSRCLADKKLRYGYGTCAAIGIKQIFGHRAARIFLLFLPSRQAETMVCSELLVKLWRISHPNFLFDQDSRLVSPAELHRALLLPEPLDLTN
jgi:hypothetical protein